MPSVLRRRSYGSVKVFWLDRDLALKNLRESALRLVREKPEVEEVRLFGSLAEGRAVPGSDADILLVLRNEGSPFFERPLKYLAYFAKVGLPVELFCYTREEIRKNPFAAEAYRFSLKLAEKNTRGGEG